MTEDGDDYISGMQRTARWMDKSRCETLCKQHSWCRGIRFGRFVFVGICRLLSKKQPEPIDGWTAYDFGNWAEPAQWKNGRLPIYKCYEKIITGGFFIQ